MNDALLKRFLLCAAAVTAAVALLYVAVRYLLPWLLPFLIAAALAAAIEPAVRGLQKRLHLKRGFSSLVLTLFMIFVLGGLLALLGTTLTGEAYALLRRVPALLAVIPETLRGLLARLERYAALCPPWLRSAVEETLTRSAADAGTLLGMLAERLIAALGSFVAALPKVFFAAATAVLAVYFTSSSLPDLQSIYVRSISAKARQRVDSLHQVFARSVSRWLRSELTLCAVTFAELLTGFWFLRQPYSLLLAFLITLVDALPVFGTGTVLLPWALIEVLMQNTPKALCLALLYLVTLTVRNILEPRLLGAVAGVPPILSLLAMYLGFCTFGVGGMVLFPFVLLLVSQFRKP